MKVYIAAPYAARPQAARYAAELSRMGFAITSTWITEDHDIAPGTVGPASELTDAEVAAHVRTDLDDVEDADILLVLTAAAAETGNHPSTTGGRHVETGYFIATRGLGNVIVVGEAEHIFHRCMTVVPDWHEAVLELVAHRHDLRVAVSGES